MHQSGRSIVAQNTHYKVLVFALTIASTTSLSACNGTDSDDSTCRLSEVGDFYESRVEPLLRAEVSTCSQCHLSGVGLEAYVRKDACHTMACMIALGEVDLAQPENSAILGRVGQAVPESELITTDVIEAEYLGLYEWIVFSARCHNSACGAIEDPCAGTAETIAAEPSLAPTGMCDLNALATQFEERVYRWKERCGACHSSGATVDGAPGWLDLGSSERTLFNLLGRSMVDIETPEKSTLLTKPLSTADPAGVPHGGGNKFADRGDPTYQDFRAWVEYFAACHTGTTPSMPSVNIDSPLQDSAWESGATIPLLGTADDPQDGALAGEQLEWLVDGQRVGAGSTTEISPKDGYLRIQLLATDSDGEQGTRSVSIYVGGHCKGAADKARVDSEDAFFDALNGCDSCGTNSACLKACLNDSFSGGCAGCAAEYKLCQVEHCQDACNTPGDGCGRCISLHCGEAWRDCSGTPEPF